MCCITFSHTYTDRHTLCSSVLYLSPFYPPSCTSLPFSHTRLNSPTPPPHSCPLLHVPLAHFLSPSLLLYLPSSYLPPSLISLLPFPTRTPGKWHLGGMREENRLQRTNDDNCHFPSPNQHGFEEYISGHFHQNLFFISNVFVFLCLCFLCFFVFN